jgi:hypothetical protein
MSIKTQITTKYGFRPTEAAFALGSEKLLDECVAAEWIKPVVKRHKLTLYDRGDIASCWSRILAGEMPSNHREAQAGGLGRYEVREVGAAK